MKLCKRIWAGLAFFLGMVGLLLSLAGGIGVWFVKKPVTDRATRVFERIEASLDVAVRGLDHVKTSLDSAAERLEGIKQEQRKQPRPNNTIRRFLAQRVQQSISPEFTNAHDTFRTVAEASVVVNSVLEDLDNLPFLSESGMDTSRLAEINRGLTQVETSAWELSRLFGDPEQGSDGTGAEMSRIEHTLQTLQRLIAEYEPQLTQTRQRTEDLKARTFSWITPGTVLISLVCFWLAFSQGNVLPRACSWWRGSGNNSSSPG
jgi:hypothetical protein